MPSLIRSSVRAFTAAATRAGSVSGAGSTRPPTASITTTGIIQPQQRQQQQRQRTFSKKIIDIRRSEQRSVWSSYLSGTTSASSLFNEIDLNKNDTISVEEINYFLDSVERSGVKEDKFKLLQHLGYDHQLDSGEFERWLLMATDAKNDGTEIAKGESDSDSSDSSDDDEPKRKKIIVDARHGLQSMVWQIFLTTGTQASDLFKMIDLNRSSSISVQEISYFIKSIGGQGVSHGKLLELKVKGADHELNEEEFYEWLSDATGVELNADGECEDLRIVMDSSGGKGCTPGQL